MVDTRRKIEGLFGKEDGLAIHQLEGKTRRAPARLKLQVQRLLIALERYRGKPRRVKGAVTVDVECFLAELQPAYDRLLELLHELTEAKGAESAARDRRQKEIQAFDAVYVKALHYLEAMFALSGVETRPRAFRSYIQRRRLSRWARSKREAYAAGKPGSDPESPEGSRSLGTRIAGWFRGRRSNRPRVA